MRRMTKNDVQVGVCLSVAHAACLIQDASILYVAHRISSSFCLAVMAREELGRANLLLQAAAEMHGDATVDAEELSSQLQDHVAKLDAGQFTTHVALPSAFMKEWTSAIERKDKAVLEHLQTKRKKIVARVRQHDPALLHTRRLKAQYVDLDGKRGVWSRPSNTKKKDAWSLVATVASEIFDWIRWAEDDTSIAADFAKTKQKLPSTVEYWDRVMAPIAAHGS